MKFLIALTLILASTTVHAQSRSRYDVGFRAEQTVPAIKYTTIEALLGVGLAYTPSGQKWETILWKKAIPTESAAFAKALKANLDARKAYYKAVATHKVKGNLLTRGAAEEKAAFEKTSAELKTVSAEFNAAKTAKLQTYGLPKRLLKGTAGKALRVVGWIRNGIVIYAVVDATFRTVVILTDAVAGNLNDSNLEALNEQGLKDFLARN